MRVEPLPIEGAFTIKFDTSYDERGGFGRTFCARAFREHGLEHVFPQQNISTNRKKGTFRGLHYQKAPYEEAKLVRCISGAAIDFVVDIRADSRSFMRWASVEISKKNGLAVYLPKGCAHGFYTLKNNTEVLYLMSEFYYPELASGVRWDDPAFNLDMPGKIMNISDRDSSFEFFRQGMF